MAPFIIFRGVGQRCHAMRCDENYLVDFEGVIGALALFDDHQATHSSPLHVCMMPQELCKVDSNKVKKH